jgi:cyclopropane fatty-acyl-phospholipid synthase-like methyltransferase
MDSITDSVIAMYDAYPYPSPKAALDKHQFAELANLLDIFALECSYDFKDKRILDAGTGTGQRLLNAARQLPEARFLGVDLSARALGVAADTARALGIGNVSFEVSNLLECGWTERFDMILCMGVLHHLSIPEKGIRNLAAQLTPDGVAWIYVYGERGSRERLRRKEIIRELLGGRIDDLRTGIQLIRDLGFEASDYGWNVKDVDDAGTAEALLVDAYLNRNETAYNAASLHELMRASGLYGYAVYGVTCGAAGLLVETRTDAQARLSIARTDPRAHLKAAGAVTTFQRLSIEERLRVLDLFYEPNGYTVLGLTKPAVEALSKDSRVRANLVTLEKA